MFMTIDIIYSFPGLDFDGPVYMTFPGFRDIRPCLLVFHFGE